MDASWGVYIPTNAGAPGPGNGQAPAPSIAAPSLNVDEFALSFVNVVASVYTKYVKGPHSNSATSTGGWGYIPSGAKANLWAAWTIADRPRSTGIVSTH